MLAPVTGPELSVVCKSCGSEVSPYVTECPYCGSRIRKRAPKLQREGGELKPEEPRRRRARTRRRPAEPRLRAGRAYVTTAAIVGPAVILLAQQALKRFPSDFGAIVGPVGSEWWRYLAAPFVYTNVGYLFVIALALALFAAPLEERLGPAPVAILIVACGSLGMLAADGIETLIRGETDFTLASGGNGAALGVLAAWLTIRRAEIRRYPADEIDVIGIAVCAVVLLALPVVVIWANVWAGLAGALVGGLAGLSAAFMSRGTAQP
jgi:membrane associated rhomboid family serine protease/DNA-directed RNA polymerase subunit RPC12/RpoP